VCLVDGTGRQEGRYRVLQAARLVVHGAFLRVTEHLEHALQTLELLRGLLHPARWPRARQQAPGGPLLGFCDSPEALLRGFA
jgi:hypothetical protein